MKNIFKYILCFVFCVGFIFATTSTVNAEDTYDVMYPEAVWKVGDVARYYATHYLEDGSYYTVDYSYEITKDSECRSAVLYLLNNNNSDSGYVYDDYDNVLPGCDIILHKLDGSTVKYSSASWSRLAPKGYSIYDDRYVSSIVSTNIPIFESKEIALAYENGEIDITKALNYKKTYENGSWVKPFEDIEINDSNMSSPQLANVSHSGFSVINVPDDRYMVDVYLESGVQNPLPYEMGLTSIGDSLFVNSFGLVSDTEGAFTGDIDLLSCYGVDNITALNSSVSQFYSTYPNMNAYNRTNLVDLKINKTTWSIWGQPFGKSFVFFSGSTSANGTISADFCPLAYTNYKVRYFYYDDNSGFHYGPWTNFIYFSDGRVMRGEIFQGNDGNIIESPLESGTQDSNGNVSMNFGSLIDIENPNDLFGYLRSVINNINATGNSFMTLFGTVFSFLPADMLAIIWLGIGCMILIGIIRAFN